MKHKIKQYSRRAAKLTPQRIRNISTIHDLYNRAMLLGEARIGFKTIQFPNGKECELFLNLTESSDRKLFVGQNYEPDDVRAFLSLVEVEDTVLDIGGYIGYYSILASLEVGDIGSVIVFEAHPQNYERIVRTVEHNSLTNVSVENLAISDEVGSTSVHVSSDPTAHSLAEETNEFFLQDHCQTGEKIEVPTTTVDSYLEESDLQPDLLKIDVEGAELDVLYGAQEFIKDVGPKVLLSVHEQKLPAFDETPEELYAFLNKTDLEVFLVTEHGPTPIDSRPSKSQYTLLLR